jgi:hypothetical protein
MIRNSWYIITYTRQPTFSSVLIEVFNHGTHGYLTFHRAYIILKAAPLLGRLLFWNLQEVVPRIRLDYIEQGMKALVASRGPQ